MGEYPADETNLTKVPKGVPGQGPNITSVKWASGVGWWWLTNKATGLLGYHTFTHGCTTMARPSRT
eukprot:6118009-Karenia_brevis.AAC.1